jgi:hypothetical protein
MSEISVSRRDILRTLAMGAAGGSVLQVIPAKAAEYAHQIVHSEKSASPAGSYVPKYFPAHQYAMLNSLCETIIPKDDKSGGAIEAGAPEFIDCSLVRTKSISSPSAAGSSGSTIFAPIAIPMHFWIAPRNSAKRCWT